MTEEFGKELCGLKKAGFRDHIVRRRTERASKRRVFEPGSIAGSAVSKRPGFVIAQGCDSAVRK